MATAASTVFEPIASRPPPTSAKGAMAWLRTNPPGSTTSTIGVRRVEKIEV